MLEEPAEPRVSLIKSKKTEFGSTDKVGKVFSVLNHDLRFCLICGNAYTRQGAAEHADRVCYPS
jgi:hypothetical protein